ncbi:protein lin-52 homolog isoform X3 [Apis cerana]|uniref:protein lin-52 homolog isoform X3 n=1 Tax=Apis cerana TaxID=7461 RepID=UPI002B239996|nr:protein lin-52 homolog isoform X3 [Apis cerana]
MNIMTTEEPTEPDLICVEESLMSLEKLDRASPDLWPEQSVNEFVAQNSPQTEPSAWAAGLTPDDINQLHPHLWSRIFVTANCLAKSTFLLKFLSKWKYK